MKSMFADWLVGRQEPLAHPSSSKHLDGPLFFLSFYLSLIDVVPVRKIGGTFCASGFAGHFGRL
jgi:hypothetical protein